MHRIVFYIWIVIAMLSLCSATFAQRISLDVHTGLNHTQILDHPIYDKPVNKLSLGLGSCYHFNNYLAANLELNYEQKGGKGTVYLYNDYGYEVQSYEQTQQLYYITVPLMVQCAIGKGNWRAIINAGGYYGFLAGAWVNPQAQGLDRNVRNNFKRNDVGLIGGLCVRYQLAPDWGLSLEWRSSRGLATLAKEGKDQYNFSTGLMLGVHYVIEHGED